MVLYVADVLPTLLDIAVREAVERILGKVKEGKKLTDAEVTLLLVGELAKRITALEKRVEEVREELARRIDDSRDMMATKITALETRITALEKRVEEVREELARRIDDSRDMMATKITALETRITALEKRAEGLEKRVEGLETEAKGLRSEVYSIKSDVIMLLKSWLEEKIGAK